MSRAPTQNEARILAALAWMCEQYLNDGSGFLDDKAMCAGENALKVLSEYGLADTSGSGRGGAWTDAGQELLDRS
ncbi:MAG: hypothetical protein AAF687_07675 [Pseudomonadota bacterium]